MWQFVGDFSVMSTDRAFIRGEWIARFEHTLHLPSERSVQDLILNHAGLVQAANLYYDTMHFGIMFVFLLWMFVRHRDRYSAIRTTLAITTLACLAIQFIPVAPPRLLPGFVDTAAVYGQSVYAGGGLEGNLAAMPSIHVAWAVVIAWYTMRITRSRWRYLGPAARRDHGVRRRRDRQPLVARRHRRGRRAGPVRVAALRGGPGLVRVRRVTSGASECGRRRRARRRHHGASARRVKVPRFRLHGALVGSRAPGVPGVRTSTAATVTGDHLLDHHGADARGVRWRNEFRGEDCARS